MKVVNRPLVIIGALALILILVSPKQGVAAEDELLTLSYLGRSDLPRGIRNNNPGNIKIANNPWQGKTPESQNTDGVFEQFSSYVYGIRAMIKLVRDNYLASGFDTIAKIITRYAPPGTSENNNTTAYINDVANRSGIGKDQPLGSDFNTMSRVLPAMAHHENGQEAITPELFTAAWAIV